MKGIWKPPLWGSSLEDLWNSKNLCLYWHLALCVCGRSKRMRLVIDWWCQNNRLNHWMWLKQKWPFLCPSEEVRDVVNAFTQPIGPKGQAYHGWFPRYDWSRALPLINVLYYMNVRRSWYIVAHRYKNDSYGRLALDRLYNDYKQFFTEHATVSEDARIGLCATNHRYLGS